MSEIQMDEPATILIWKDLINVTGNFRTRAFLVLVLIYYCIF